MLSPLGAPLFAYLLLRSRLSHKRGSVAWKGREYGSRTETTERELARRDAERRAITEN